MVQGPGEGLVGRVLGEMRIAGDDEQRRVQPHVLAHVPLLEIEGK
jgi:hypothetical protein